MEMPLVLRLPRDMHLQVPMPAIVFAITAKPSRLCHFWQGAESIAPATQYHIKTSKEKWSETVHV